MRTAYQTLRNTFMTLRHLDQAALYEIRVFGGPEAGLQDWLDGMVVTADEAGTRVTGIVADQAALHGILQTLYSLGCSVLLVRRVESIGSGTGPK